MASPITAGPDLSALQGLNFTVIGPFFVADLSNNEQLFATIAVGKHGMENVGRRKKTRSHDHAFISLYKSAALDVESEGKRFSLPKKALTLVPPGVPHSWVPQRSGGAVGSVDRRHRKQEVA